MTHTTIRLHCPHCRAIIRISGGLLTVSGRMAVCEYDVDCPQCGPRRGPHGECLPTIAAGQKMRLAGTGVLIGVE